MARSIPIDVIREMRNKISDMKAKSDCLKMDANEAKIKADLLHYEALRLEMMVDKWMELFPDTVK